MSDKIVHTSDAAFDADVLQNSKAVLLDFWAEWCGPCKMIAPLLDEVADKYEDKLDVVKLNVDENPQTAAKYRVMSIPTILFFKDGQVVDTVVGAVPERALQPKVDSLL